MIVKAPISNKKPRGSETEGLRHADLAPFVQKRAVSVSEGPMWLSQIIRQIWRACGISPRMKASQAVTAFQERFRSCRSLIEQLASKGIQLLGAEQVEDKEVVSVKFACELAGKHRIFMLNDYPPAFA